MVEHNRRHRQNHVDGISRMCRIHDQLIVADILCTDMLYHNATNKEKVKSCQILLVMKW